jgi:DNA-binding transcriptional MerR regulator
MATVPGENGGDDLPPTPWKVGELARRTGLSVRTLHYYDEIGLLSPSARTASGHRLYTAGDVARLQQVRSLRQLGLSLGEILDGLRHPGYSPRGVIRRHLERLREQIEQQRRLCRLLEAIMARYGAAEEVSVAELTTTIEVMTMLEKYYDPQQLETLEQRRREIGEERIREVEGEWPRLIAQVRAEMEQGTPPSDPRVQELARRWMGLMREFTGGDPAIAGSVARMYQQEPSVRARSGIDSRMFDYVNQAIAATRPSRL